MDYKKLTHAAVKGLKHIGQFVHRCGDDPHPLDCSLAGRVSQVFLVGMTSAHAICRDAGEDPDHRERYCESCGILVDNASDLDEVGFCDHCAINADH